jgi:hypothetical protein
MSTRANELYWVVITLWTETMYLNLFYYFVILFECNNIVILNLIIFYLIVINMWIHIDRYKKF